jgi:outer membrane protein assembly factor BamB
MQLDVVALNPDGSLKWRTIFNEAYYCASSITIGQDGSLYFPGETDDGDVHYLFACSEDGSLKWRIDIPYLNRIRASVSIGGDGTLYVGTKASSQHEAVFLAIDPSNGQIYWEFIAEGKHGVPDDIYVSATIGMDGIIYFSCENAIFYALNSDGSEAWRIDFGLLNGGTPGFSCPVIDLNGTIYQTIFGNEGGIYAIKSDSKGLAITPWPKFRQNNKNTGRGI